MTDAEIINLMIETAKKGTEISSVIHYLLNSIWSQYNDTECRLKSKIKDTLQLYPDQNMQQYMLEYIIDDLCRSVDTHAKVLKSFLRKDLGCVLEESQKSEAV